MLRIRPEQMRAFRADALARFEMEMADHASRFAPHHAAGLGDEQLKLCVRRMVSRARSRGFALRASVQLWVELTFMFGIGFDTDPQLRVVAEFANPAAAPHQADELARAMKLRETAVNLAGRIAGTAGELERAAVQRFRKLSLDDLALQSDQQVIDLLKYVHPEKVDAVGITSLHLVIEEGRAQAEARELMHPAGPTALALLMFTFGYDCMDDPLFPWIGESLDAGQRDAGARLELTRRKALRFVSFASPGV